MANRDADLSGSLRNIHVLLVDEDGESLEQIQRGLEYCGAVVSARTSARRGLSVLEAVRPNILVIGVSGPEEIAYALIRSVRALPADHAGTVPAIALTPLGSQVSRERLGAEGFQASLAKPVSLMALCETIRRVLAEESSDQNVGR